MLHTAANWHAVLPCLVSASVLFEGYRYVLMLDVCWVLQSRYESAEVEKSINEEEAEGNHHDQRFETAAGC